MHTSAEVISLEDVERAAALLTGFLFEVNAKTDWIPR